ncbi:hypothetical protein GGH91_001248 [Coemansia sp. RSA 2671]|nr:hypothetical protein IWW57_000187 [Coemansia sp. S610]KAJ2348665.1 hypothetical protein GGH91_001248 [Coemansia sp. RSA 2671]
MRILLRQFALRQPLSSIRTMNTSASLILDYDYATSQVTEHESEMSASEFMLSGGDGIYTAMRTVCHGTRLFLFDDHLQRICKSHSVLLSKEDGVKQRQLDTEYWRGLLAPLIRRGLNRFGSGSDQDSKITVLVDRNRVAVQFVRLLGPNGLDPSCWVKFVSGRRDHPEAKSLQWVHDREALEQLIVSPINEVVLIEHDSKDGPLRFYEGLSSNFFVTRRVSLGRQPEYLNFQLLSAPLDSVLLGTIMKLVLQICDRDGISVRYAPEFDALESWNGAFVSSTSRLVLPVSRIIYGEDSRQHSLNASDPLVVHLRDSVRNMAREKSTQI